MPCPLQLLPLVVALDASEARSWVRLGDARGRLTYGGDALAALLAARTTSIDAMHGHVRAPARPPRRERAPVRPPRGYAYCHYHWCGAFRTRAEDVHDAMPDLLRRLRLPAGSAELFKAVVAALAG